MITELSFDHDYEILLFNEIKNGYPLYHFPKKVLVGQDGHIVNIITNEENWIGVFAFGKFIKNGFNGIYSMPDSKKFCVVSNSAGYIVEINKPFNCIEMDSIPIMDVRLNVKKGIIVFADCTEITAYNKNGLAWRTQRLAFDGFKILEVNDNTLKGEYYDIRSGAMETFEVNLENGKHKSRLGDINI